VNIIAPFGFLGETYTIYGFISMLMIIGETYTIYGFISMLMIIGRVVMNILCKQKMKCRSLAIK